MRRFFYSNWYSVCFSFLNNLLVCYILRLFIWFILFLYFSTSLLRTREYLFFRRSVFLVWIFVAFLLFMSLLTCFFYHVCGFSLHLKSLTTRRRSRYLDSICLIPCLYWINAFRIHRSVIDDSFINILDILFSTCGCWKYKFWNKEIVIRVLLTGPYLMRWNI